MELRTSDFCAAFVKQAGQARRRISGNIAKDILEIIAEQRHLGKSECAGYLLLWAKYCVLRKYIAHIAVPLSASRQIAQICRNRYSQSALSRLGKDTYFYGKMRLIKREKGCGSPAILSRVTAVIFAES